MALVTEVGVKAIKGGIKKESNREVRQVVVEVLQINRRSIENSRNRSKESKTNKNERKIKCYSDTNLYLK